MTLKQTSHEQHAACELYYNIYVTYNNQLQK